MTDSLLCGLQMYRNLTTTWREELQKTDHAGNAAIAAKVNLLFPSRIGTEFQPGSNAWAISGKHTASGKPILANDPHLDWSHPVHLVSSAFARRPVSMSPAFRCLELPCVIIGHNQRIAWGVTNLGFDVQDLYIEKIDPQTGRYCFTGSWSRRARNRNGFA